MNKYVLMASCCAIFVGATISPAAAQTAPPPSGGEQPASSGEVVVTAQRRSERLQDVPISVVNISSQQLQDAGIQSLAQIQSVTPALRFDNAGPFYQATIRGVGSSLVTTGSGANVGIYIDGFYSPNPQAADLQLLNVQSVEVLKGPQGTLFGRNTTGGAILVTTTKPSETRSGMLDVSYGNFNAQKYQGYATTGLTDHVAADLGFVLNQGDGWLHNITTHDNKIGAYRNWSIRGGLNVEVTDKVSVLFHYLHDSTNDPTSMEGNAYVQNGQPLSLAAIVPGAIVATRPDDVADSGHVGFVAQHDIYQLAPKFELPFATLTAYTQYRQENSTFYEDGVPSSANILYITVPVKDQTFSQELLLTSKPGSRLQWTAGAFYIDYRDLFAADISLQGAPFFKAASSYSDTVSEAGFLDLTYQLLDKLYLTVGARYSHDEVRNGWYAVGPAPRVDAPTLKGDKVTPRVVARYAFDSQTSVYASYTRGYKAAIYNLGGDSTVPVEPESISAYELGFKHEERRYALDLAGFYYDYTNLQVANYGVSPQNVPVSEITNAANARIFGVEVQGRYKITDNLNLSTSLAYLNAKYTSFKNSPGYVSCLTLVNPDPSCQISLTPPVNISNYGMTIASVKNASGFEMQRSPDFTATVGARYTNSVAGGLLALSGNVYYTSKFYFDSSQQISQGAYATLGLRAEWTDPSDRYTVAFFGDNVTGTRYRTAGQASTPFGVINSWSSPALFGGEIRARFQ